MKGKHFYIGLLMIYCNMIGAQNLIMNPSFESSLRDGNVKYVEHWQFSGMLHVCDYSYLNKNKLFHPKYGDNKDYIFINAYKETTLQDSLIHIRMGRMNQYLRHKLLPGKQYIFGINLAFRALGSTFQSDELMIELAKEINTPAIESRKLPKLLKNIDEWYTWSEIIEPKDTIRLMRFGFLREFSKMMQYECSQCDNMREILTYYQGKIEVVSFFADDMFLYEVHQLDDSLVQALFIQNVNPDTITKYLEDNKMEKIWFRPNMDSDTSWLIEVKNVHVIDNIHRNSKAVAYVLF